MGVHTIWYYLAMQFLGGAVQSTGWPGVVTVVANWFGKGKKGFIFGVWNAHTSIGNIVGGLLAGRFVDTDWGLSFAVPGLVIAAMGVIVWFVLPVQPSDLGFSQEELLPNEVSKFLGVPIGIFFGFFFFITFIVFYILYNYIRLPRFMYLLI